MTNHHNVEDGGGPTTNAIKPGPPAPVRPRHAEPLTVHRPAPPRPCHVHVYGPTILVRGWTVSCDCGRMPLWFSKEKRAYRTEAEATEAGRQHLSGGLYA